MKRRNKENKKETCTQNLNMNKIRLINSKRSQITIFIIVAVIIVASIAIFFAYKSDLPIGKKYPSEVSQIANFIQQCLDKSAEESIYLIGQKGGYKNPEFITESGETYYLIDGKNYFPSKEQIEDEISLEIESKMFICLDYFSAFPEYEVEQGNLKSSSEIRDSEVILKIEYPLAIKRGESVSVIKDFISEIPARVGIVHETVSEFIFEQEKNIENGVCLNCLPEDFGENGLYLNITAEGNKTSVFRIVDNTSLLNKKPFEWVFAIKF